MSDPYRPRPAPSLAADAHKGDAGRLLAVCGSQIMPGASVLVCRAAHRAGAGLVTLACLDDNVLRAVPPASPETVLLDARGEAGGAASWLADRPDHALAAGPGLGATPRTRELVEALLGPAWCGPLALDADALNVLAGEAERLRERAGALVATPHPGEAARLLGRDVPADPEGREAAARELALRSGAIVCLKGSGTVVTDGRRAFVNDSGNPGMATAGSGDVLLGILGAYLAIPPRIADPAGWSAFDAATAAVHVHGLAGDLAAAELGPRSVIASDLVEYLPAAQDLLAECAEEGA